MDLLEGINNLMDYLANDLSIRSDGNKMARVAYAFTLMGRSDAGSFLQYFIAAETDADGECIHL